MPIAGHSHVQGFPPGTGLEDLGRVGGKRYIEVYKELSTIPGSWSDHGKPLNAKQKMPQKEEF